MGGWCVPIEGKGAVVVYYNMERIEDSVGGIWIMHVS